MSIILRAVLATTVVLLAASASADCQKNRSREVICGKGQCERTRNGEVFCSRFKDGAAVKTRDGEVKCGRGLCERRTSDGVVICSSVEGGSIFKELDGSMRCEGTCEFGSIDLCESVPAGALLRP
jgi:uncharacterized low-complexity protein